MPETTATKAADAPKAAPARPTSPHSAMGPPSQLNNGSRQTRARAKKCRPTTSEIHATETYGAPTGPLRTAMPAAMATTSTATTTQ
jgi:hypothetical protein